MKETGGPPFYLTEYIDRITVSAHAKTSQVGMCWV